MPDQRVVSNTSPLLYLYQVGQIELLPKLYGSVMIPPAVQDELGRGKEIGAAVPDVETFPWIEIRPLPDATLLPTITDLGPGEAEAIALALFHPGSLLILDDDLGRRIARLNRITFTGTLGVLIKAKQAGLLPKVAPILAALQQTSMWLGRDLIQLVLSETGED